MKAVYHYTVIRKEERRKAVLSSLGAALAMARHDMQFAARVYEAIRIEADGLVYSPDDIMSLTDMDCRGGIIVKLPVLLR